MSLETRRSYRPLVGGAALLSGLAMLVAGLGAPAGAAPAPPADPTPAEPVGTLSTQTADPVVLEALRTDGEADFAINVTERADLSAAYEMRDWDARGAWVAEHLRATADESQATVREALDAAGVTYDTFWAANTIIVQDGSLDLAEQVVALQEVGRLHEVPEFPVPSLRQEDVAMAQDDAVEWGIEAIGADRVWAEVGVRGEGIVVAGIDTGVQFDHPALADRYRGRHADGTVDHDYHWFDPAGICGTPNLPCDTQGHGTHTTGTTVGGVDDAGVGIGVAPGARWIAAKGCEAVPGVDCSLDALLRSGEWTLEPTDREGENPRADLRPHIVNNSWGADTGPIDDPFYDQVLRAWNASGMFAVFSNGNAGERGCRTVGSPADSLDAYGVGAFDESGAIAPFSSRGPGASGQIRPNIAAPGVAVRSAIPGDRYSHGNGTSMAAPHVAGTVALMWSVAPGLVGDVHSTRELLDQTAVDVEDLSCGGTPENNNVFGEGRLDARAAVATAPTGPTGTLTGTVVDSESDDPAARVTVTATPADDGAVRRTTTSVDGRYSIVLPAADYELRFDAYGYTPAEGESVTVEADETTTHDQRLQPLPTVTLSGTVTDGSGHGWPLYAAVHIDGYPHGVVHTDPGTGRYEVDLPADTAYAIRVTTPYEGYLQRTEQVQVGSEDATADLTLAVDAERHCPALGYEPAYAGRFEPFDSGELPGGWEVETSIGDGWTFANLADRANGTGGDGEYAMVDSNSGKRIEASVLTSPATDLSASTGPELAFRTEVFARNRSSVTAEVSVDGGRKWDVVWSRRSNVSGPHLVREALPQAAGAPDVRVRFTYDGENNSQTGLWQLDDVLLGEVSCTPVQGGLVIGQVHDDRTDAVVDGATVTVGDAVTTTVATPSDPDLVGGLYWLFSPTTGSVTVAVDNALGQHHRSTVDVVVAPSGTARADVDLSSGELVIASSRAELSAVLGEAAQTTVTVSNVGTAPASFELVERDAAMEIPDPHDSEWTRLADMRNARFHGLVDIHDDTLVYIGGSADGASPISQRNYTYSIRNDEWRLTDSFQEYRANSAGGFVGDLMYIIGGGGGTRGLQSSVLIYDPETDAMTQGTDAPQAFISAGSAIYEDRIYVIGGWNSDNDLMADAGVYDPATDSWAEIAPYPEGIGGQMCGTIDGTIYCAGGIARDGDGTAHTSRAYGYRPETDSWFRIADLPRPVVAAGYTAANGLLLISGGQVGGYRSNEGFYYDPAVGTWQDLPRSLFDLFGVGSGCGFYKVGGTQGRPGFFPWVEVLPGFDDCDTSGGDRVDWLAASSGSETVQPGESVTVTLRADTAALDQPGTYGAQLMVLEDTPHRADPLTVSLDVSTPARWGAISGTVTGLARCDGPATPLEDATVRFRADGVDATVTTDDAGAYTYYLPVPRSRLQMTVSADGMVEQARDVRPAPNRTKTEDVELRTDEPCAVAEPARLDVEVPAGGSADVGVTLSNADGAAPYTFSAADTTAVLGAAVGAAPSTAAVTGDEAPSWTDATPVPGGRRAYGHAQCATRPDVTYMIGGTTTANPLTRRTWSYDTSNDTWTELAQIPETGASIRAVCHAGTIHAFVGDGVDRHFVYDIARDVWSEATALPRPVDHAATAAWDGRIYVVGGTGDHDSYATLDTVYVYDVATDTWSEGAAMPSAATHSGFTQRGSDLYVVGGRDARRDRGEWDSDVVQRLDLASGGWSTGPSLLHARSELGAVATSEAIYAIGGVGESEYGRIPTTTVQRLSLDEWDDGAWRDDTVAQLPDPASLNTAGWCTSGRSGGEIWAAGGNRFSNRSLYLPVPGETCVGVGPDASWMALDATAGTVAAGDVRRLTVTVDATGLTAGDALAGTIVVTTDDPGAPVIHVPVRVAVTAADGA